MPQRQVPLRRATSQEQPNWEGDAVTEKTEDATIAKANLVEHLKNIDAAIATTFWIKQPNSDAFRVDPSLRKTVIGSTTFARLVTAI